MTASPASGSPALLMSTMTLRSSVLTARWIVPGVNHRIVPGASGVSWKPSPSMLWSAPAPDTTMYASVETRCIWGVPPQMPSGAWSP